MKAMDILEIIGAIMVIIPLILILLDCSIAINDKRYYDFNNPLVFYGGIIGMLGIVIFTLAGIKKEMGYCFPLKKIQLESTGNNKE